MTTAQTPDASSQDALFPTLTAEQMDCIAHHGEWFSCDVGVVLFTEGEPADAFYLIQEGQVRVTKNVAGDPTLLTVHGPSQFTGEVSLLNETRCIATGRTVTPCRLLKLDRDQFKTMLTECPSVADVILPAMAQRRPEAMVLTQQREKLAALGKMAAGLAHELNNPAAAAQRAAGQLRETLSRLQTLAMTVNLSGLTTEQRDRLSSWAQQGIAGAKQAVTQDALERSDQEEAVADWLEAHAVADNWCLAPSLVEAGLGIPELDSLAACLPAETLPDTIAWLETGFSSANLARDIEQSMGRISELVQAIKSYSYMDQGTTQDVDIHEGLESTLTILTHKLKHTAIRVVRHYDRSLPRIQAHGGELNQVWTNLLDNAIDALGDTGTIDVYTSRENDCLLIEIADTGPGIPAEIQSRVFEPFFTTKDVGAGSGLGLDTTYRIIVQRHHGDICFDSEPGKTRFQVRLPITADSSQGENPS